jgi:probable phosphoglycerate mutase
MERSSEAVDDWYDEVAGRLSSSPNGYRTGVRLVLVRHGEAYAGFSGVIGGQQGCTGLTQLGRRQAEALRDHLAASGRIQADRLLVSVLPRAIETAQIIAPSLGLEIAGHECDLCEVHTGVADGLAWEEYTARYGSFDMAAEPDRVFAPEGDSWNSFHERVQRLLARLAADHPDETIVAVCHAGVIMASMRCLLGMSPSGQGAQLRPTNTGLTEWEHDPVLDRWNLHAFNETGHLLDLDRPGGSPAADAGRQGGMTDHGDFTVESARRAAEGDELGSWVADFLASAGSDNPELGHALTHPPRTWIGPVRLRLDQLNRLAGPAEHPVLVVVDEEEWRDDVDDLEDKVEEGWEPPPLVVTYRDGQLHLEDGNHRAEGLRRAGETDAWAVISFESAAERDRFLERAGEAAGG